MPPLILPGVGLSCRGRTLTFGSDVAEAADVLGVPLQDHGDERVAVWPDGLEVVLRYEDGRLAELHTETRLPLAGGASPVDRVYEDAAALLVAAGCRPVGDQTHVRLVGFEPGVELRLGDGLVEAVTWAAE